ncbi:TIGR02147 family protein [Bdellovibrio sp. 22V]|uniref:TIGR02147 family protein n=1 Tax=Bdellovibrio sp. 22V TaxID=3044166 RepID=UPI002542B7C3|nr:TIGR02147 family protein [Bdellovibrio sp. 22V]WII73400.1 TIGR02147 family protein [Bdellovibrio sp. 22V]
MALRRFARMKYGEVAELINKVLEKRRLRNPHYSLRAFARDLKVSPSRVSNIVTGKALPGKIVRRRLATSLHLNKSEVEYLNYLIEKTRHRAKDSRNAHQLTEKDYAFLPEWYHYAILNLMETTSFQSDVEVIAQRLALAPETVQDSLNKLLKSGLIKNTPKGYAPTYKNLTSTSDIPSSALKYFHNQLINKGLDSLIRDPVDIRDITSIIIPSNPENIYKVKMLAREFRKQANELLEQGEKTEVYSVCVQIYPLTQRGTSS